VGFIFQFHHLLPEFTALENVALAAMIGGVGKKEAERKAFDALTRVGLSDRLYHMPSELSGGEQQRVAVARALLNSPKLVLADEPTGNLDSANAQQIQELVLDLNKNTGQTFVVVTHNEALASRFHRTYRMADGVLQPG
jgi:lipoprotein-releasing system ATP-binding protein